MDVEFLRYLFQDGFSGVITKHGFSIGVRHIQMAYMFVSSVVMGAIRGGIGIAVLSMSDVNRRGDSYIQIHNWDRRIEGAILSSFFFGYAMMTLPADLYLKKLGGKLLVTAMLVVNGALCVAMPTIANKGGWVAVCNAMLFMGMAHSGYSSINQSLLEKWLPPNEKKMFSSLIFGGLHLGIIAAIPISCHLSKLPLGWELIYYSLAMMTLTMAVIYGILTATSPDEHQAIGDKEKEFIKDALLCYSKKSLSKPWKKILLAPQFWAVVGAHTASNALYVFFLVDVVAYTESLGMEYCGLYLMLPFTALGVVYMSTAPFLGWISNIRLISLFVDVTTFRKLINAIGAVGVVIGLIVLSNMTPARVDYVIILLSVILAFLGFQFSGFLSSYRDMSENHSGSLMMLGSTISSLVGAGVPFINGLIVAEGKNAYKWRPVFVYLASLYVLCNVVYTMLGSNERQPWDQHGIKKTLHHYNGILDANQVQLEEFDGSSVQEKQDIDTAC